MENSKDTQPEPPPKLEPTKEITSEGCGGGFGYYKDDPSPRCYPLDSIGKEPPPGIAFCTALGCPYNPPSVKPPLPATPPTPPCPEGESECPPPTLPACPEGKECAPGTQPEPTSKPVEPQPQPEPDPEPEPELEQPNGDGDENQDKTNNDD